MRAWVEALEMPLFITQPRSHYQQRLSIKVVRIIETFCSGITESSVSCILHSAVNRVSWEVWHTFFHGACRHGFTVRTLELIEIWPHFNLIDNSFLQTRESYVPLWGDLQVLYLPWPWGGQAWGLPEQNAIALNKLRWIFHLREEAEGTGYGQVSR